MPNYRLPIRSGPHRIAAIGLYRALLTQCRALPFTNDQRDELQNIVRNRFKQSRHSRGVQRLRISFEAGYEAIDHLDAAVAGVEESRSYALDLLERAPARVKVAPAPAPASKSPQKERKDVAKSTEPNETGPAQPRKPSLFDRPLPLSQLGGKRHIPVLFSANQIPVLRIKKPQPESLSRFLRQRIQQRQKRHDRRWKLYEEKEIAAREDEWDRIVSAPASDQAMSVAGAVGRNARGKREPMWTRAVDDAIAQVQDSLDDERQKNRVMAEKMQAVVDRETLIYEEEKAEKKRAKRMQYRQRKEERLEDTSQLSESEEGRSIPPDRISKYA